MTSADDQRPAPDADAPMAADRRGGRHVGPRTRRVRRRAVPDRATPVAWLIVALVVGPASYAEWSSVNARDERGVVTTTRVLAVDHGRKFPTFDVSLPDDGGGTVVVSVDDTLELVSVGQAAEVIYDPEDVTNVELAEFGVDYFFAETGAVIALLAVVIAAERQLTRQRRLHVAASRTRLAQQ